MRRMISVTFLLALLIGAAPRTAPSGRAYVSNERSGDISVIDLSSNTVVATIPVGKRPRGVQLSPDKTRLYVALSGTPITPPGQEQSGPSDKSADAIGVIDL